MKVGKLKEFLRHVPDSADVSVLIASGHEERVRKLSLYVTPRYTELTIECRLLTEDEKREASKNPTRTPASESGED